MTDLRELTSPDVTTHDIESAEAEVERIIRSGTIWVGALVVAVALLLGPAVAAGWRPGDLPIQEQAVWWFGSAIAAGGLAALVWAGCPTLGYPVEQAWRQKRRCVRAGIVAALAGMTIAGLAVLLAPVA
jgi:hypothetical protein